MSTRRWTPSFAAWPRSVTEIVAETERLRLRTWDRQDLNDFIEHTNTPAVMRWLGGVLPREEHEAAFERLQGCHSEFGFTFWVVERKSDGALLGFCGLKPAELPGTGVHGDIEIGWRLREEAWDQGYAREAAEAALQWAWANLDVERVVSFTVPGNERSWRVMERIGMKRRPDLDFAHPKLETGHPLKPHITYAIEWP